MVAQQMVLFVHLVARQVIRSFPRHGEASRVVRETRRSEAFASFGSLPVSERRPAGAAIRGGRKAHCGAPLHRARGRR